MPYHAIKYNAVQYDPIACLYFEILILYFCEFQVETHPQKLGWSRVLFSTEIKLPSWLPSIVVNYVTANVLTDVINHMNIVLFVEYTHIYCLNCIFCLQQSTKWVKTEAERRQRSSPAPVPPNPAVVEESEVVKPPEVKQSNRNSDSGNSDSVSQRRHQSLGRLGSFFRRMKAGSRIG